MDRGYPRDQLLKRSQNRITSDYIEQFESLIDPSDESESQQNFSEILQGFQDERRRYVEKILDTEVNTPDEVVRIATLADPFYRERKYQRRN